MKRLTSLIKEYMESHEFNRRMILICILAALALVILCVSLYQFSGSRTEQIFPVYFSEVVASNSSYPNQDGICCDYIEIHNGADYAVDLTGFSIGDLSGSQMYVFPYGTVLESGSYYVVYCDSTANDTGYAPFGISRAGGETYYLIGSNGAIMDCVTTIASDMDQSIVLTETGELTLSNVLTPGQENKLSSAEAQDVYNLNLSTVRISEISTVGTGYVSEHGVFCDWVELYNSGSIPVDISGYTLSDNAGNDKYIFPQGTMIGAQDYLVVYCTTEVMAENLAPFKLAQFGKESLVLKNDKGLIIERLDTMAMAVGSQMLGSDGAWYLTEKPSPGFENSEQGHMAYLRQIGAEVGTVRISEAMANVMAMFPDADGDFSDWIELHNLSASPLNLAGWYLSDDPNDQQKWSFPNLEILPGERVVVFCSGKDSVLSDEVHTNFSLSSGGETIILSTSLGTVMDTVTVGKSETNCSYVFDDGSVVSFAPTPGYPNDASGYESFCQASDEPATLAIWEVMVDNNVYLPQELGECYDWVELKNVSNADIDLSQFSMTDDSDDPSLYQLPASTLAPGESIVIILSGDSALSSKNYDHAPFSLNASEDQLLLYHNGSLTDCVYLKNIPIGMSYGRKENAGGFYYMEPTPENPNLAGYRLISSEPVSQYAPGVYSSESSFEVTLEADGVIYYTTDGSSPDESSYPYTGPIQVSETLVLRAVAIEEGKLPSNIYTSTFIIGDSHDLPVVSLVTDPDGLWGKDGIYKDSLSLKEIGLSGNIAYSGSDGSFSLDCEVGMHGETSLLIFDKKSFKVRFKDGYDGPLYYDVFEDGEVTAFSSLIIRSSIESTYSTHMHDALIATVASENCDTVIAQKNKYAALYLNGEYWGLYSIREHHSQEHYASYMNVPADSVTMVRYAVDPGTDFYDLYNFMKNNSLKPDKNYSRATDILDISSFADWIILEAYMCNVDINNNMRYYYSTVDGLWRCGLVDLDLGMAGSHAAFGEVMSSFHHGNIVDSLMENAQFQDYISKRLAQLLSGPLSDENMIAKIEEMASSIRSEVILEEERWGTPVSGWQVFVDDMIDFCDGRSERMINSLCRELGYSAEQKTMYFGDLLK